MARGMRNKQVKVLFFTANAMPSDEEEALAVTLGGAVMWRNGKVASDKIKPEPCDAVASLKGSLIPTNYASAGIPRVRTAEQVAKLKPGYAHDVGYNDDDDPDELPVGQSANEPRVDPIDPPLGVNQPVAGQVGSEHLDPDFAAQLANLAGSSGQGSAIPPVVPPATPPAPVAEAPPKAARGRQSAAAAPVAPAPAQTPPAAASMPAWAPPPVPSGT